MSCHLNKELKTKYDVRAIPVRKGDTIKVMRGTFKGREGKVQTVYRRRWALHIEKLTREKTNGTYSASLTFNSRYPSPNPSASIQLPRYLIEARQGQKSATRKKEESRQSEEQAQGGPRRSRLKISQHNASY